MENFHDDMNSINYKQGLEEPFLPSTILSSIIVLDNAPYHTMQDTEPPSTSSRKADIMTPI
jgi:hypothetical protein